MNSSREDLAAQLSAIDRQLIQSLMHRVQLLKSMPEADLPRDAEMRELDYLKPLIDGSFQSAETLQQLLQWLNHGLSLSNRMARPEESIVYLGPIYSFSYLAAVKYFGLGANLVPVSTISAAFEEVQRKQATYAVVPVENNTDGRIVDTLGMFAKSPVQICGEILLPIHHCLLGSCDRNSIREVHSKAQPFSQCRNWLATHLPNAKLVEVGSTAEAAAIAAKSDTIAAIASREAGIHYGCRVLAENIEDNSQNLTRFAVIGDKPCKPTGNDKTSLMIQLSHRPGALADAMLVFKNAGVNLTWIESFPLPNRPSEYLFFVELEGHRETAAVRDSINKLAQQSVRLDVLGSYSKGQPL